jgi:hypothetical protein
VIIEIIDAIILASAAFLGLFYFRKSGILFRLLTLYLLYTLISEVVSYISSRLFQNNSLVQKIYLFVEIIFISGIYYSLFKYSRKKRIILFLSSFLFLFCFFYFILDKQALLPGYPLTLESIMLIIFSVMYFYQLLKYPYEHDLLSMGEFWLNSSVLVYSTGSFVFWVTFHYLYSHHIVLPGLPVIMNALDILHYSLFGLAIFFHVKRKSLIMHENANG